MEINFCLREIKINFLYNYYCFREIFKFEAVLALKYQKNNYCVLNDRNTKFIAYCLNNKNCRNILKLSYQKIQIKIKIYTKFLSNPYKNQITRYIFTRLILIESYKTNFRYFKTTQ